MKERIWPRPTRREQVSLLILILAALSPVYLLLLAPTAWGWSILAAVCFWPALGNITCRMIRDKSWPRIIGGPAVTWAGKTHTLFQSSNSRRP